LWHFRFGNSNQPADRLFNCRCSQVRDSLRLAARDHPLDHRAGFAAVLSSVATGLQARVELSHMIAEWATFLLDESILAGINHTIPAQSLVRFVLCSDPLGRFFVSGFCALHLPIAGGRHPGRIPIPVAVAIATALEDRCHQKVPFL